MKKVILLMAVLAGMALSVACGDEGPKEEDFFFVTRVSTKSEEIGRAHV